MNVKVAVFGTLRFPSNRMAEVLPHLKTLVDTTYKYDGCIAYDVALDPYDDGLIRFSELWPSQASLDNHLIAPHIEPWRAVAKQCGLLARELIAYEQSASRSL